MWVCAISRLSIDHGDDDTAVGGPVERVQGRHVLVAESEVEQLKILVNSRRGHGFRNHDQTALDLKKT